ncbi:MAG TPA: hypothetical protein VM368_04270 [Flavisolibacter sp.]|nr:hypothetical protein [Flavisolibacter sp.]
MKNKPARLKVIYLVIGLTAFIVAAILCGPYLMKYLSSPEKNIKSDYSGNLYLLEHDYVYAVTLEINDVKSTLLMVKDEQNQFDVWKPGQNANRIYATAFMIDSSGTCITSSYAVSPWYNKADRELLNSILKREFDLQDYQVSINGYSLGMKLEKYDRSANDTIKLNYKPLGYTDEDADDFTNYIQHAGNDKMSSFKPVKFPEAINPDKEKLYLFGPIDQQASATFTKDVVVTTLNKNEITNTRFFNFTETGKRLAEGAPVFNKEGELIGVYSYFNKVDSTNTIISSPIRKSTLLADYILQQAQIPSSESFIFLENSGIEQGSAVTNKEWKTVMELKDDSQFGIPAGSAPYSNVGQSVGSTNVETNESDWHSPEIIIDNKNTRLLITIDKLVKAEEYTSVLKIIILEKDKKGYNEKEMVSFQYDQEGTFVENIWRFGGIFKIQVNGMEGCKFKIELQEEK